MGQNALKFLLSHLAAQWAPEAPFRPDALEGEKVRPFAVVPLDDFLNTPLHAPPPPLRLPVALGKMYAGLPYLDFLGTNSRPPAEVNKKLAF